MQVRGILLLILYALTWAFAVAGALQQHKDRKAKPISDEAVSLLVAWVAFPVAAMLLISFAKPLFYPRYLLMCVPAIVLLAGQGLAVLEQRIPSGRPIALGTLLTIVALAALGVRDYYMSFRAYGNDWRSATQHVLSNQQAGDAIILYTFSGHRVFEYYVTREREEGKATSTPEILFPLVLDPEGIENRTQSYRRVWLLLHQTRSTAFTDAQDELIRSALGEHFRLAREQEFTGTGANRGESGNITVALYSRPASSLPGASSDSKTGTAAVNKIAKHIE
jgi:4-amino-4-deoxy-L-arabinose transferase-like glycosyltransferase